MSTTKEKDWPAFPCEIGPASDMYTIQTGDGQWQQPGMTLRQYAAIKLKVPDSGTDWLDLMITKSLLDEFAAKVMPEIYQRVKDGGYKRVAELAYEMADAMLKERAS